MVQMEKNIMTGLKAMTEAIRAMSLSGVVLPSTGMGLNSPAQAPVGPPSTGLRSSSAKKHVAPLSSSKALHQLERVIELIDNTASGNGGDCGGGSAAAGALETVFNGSFRPSNHAAGNLTNGYKAVNTTTNMVQHALAWYRQALGTVKVNNNGAVATKDAGKWKSKINKINGDSIRIHVNIMALFEWVATSEERATCAKKIDISNPCTILRDQTLQLDTIKDVVHRIDSVYLRKYEIKAQSTAKTPRKTGDTSRMSTTRLETMDEAKRKATATIASVGSLYGRWKTTKPVTTSFHKKSEWWIQPLVVSTATARASASSSSSSSSSSSASSSSSQVEITIQSPPPPSSSLFTLGSQVLHLSTQAISSFCGVSNSSNGNHSEGSSGKKRRLETEGTS